MAPKKQFNKGHKKTAFVESRPEDVIETSDIANRCKFNFSYFDFNQAAGQHFTDWNDRTPTSQLSKLNDKLKDYSRESLDKWQKTPVGTGRRGGRGPRQNVLEVYGDFPKKSDFIHPKHVPSDVLWARFRLEGSVRLIGFVLPESLEGKSDKNSNLFDTNTFYAVFLDKDHKFYKT